MLDWTRSSAAAPDDPAGAVSLAPLRRSGARRRCHASRRLVCCSCPWPGPAAGRPQPLVACVVAAAGWPLRVVGSACRRGRRSVRRRPRVVTLAQRSSGDVRDPLGAAADRDGYPSEPQGSRAEDRGYTGAGPSPRGGACPRVCRVACVETGVGGPDGWAGTRLARRRAPAARWPRSVTAAMVASASRRPGRRTTKPSPQRTRVPATPRRRGSGCTWAPLVVAALRPARRRRRGPVAGVNGAAGGRGARRSRRRSSPAHRVRRPGSSRPVGASARAAARPLRLELDPPALTIDLEVDLELGLGARRAHDDAELVREEVAQAVGRAAARRPAARSSARATATPADRGRRVAPAAGAMTVPMSDRSSTRTENESVACTPVRRSARSSSRRAASGPRPSASAASSATSSAARDAVLVAHLSGVDAVAERLLVAVAQARRPARST